MQASWEAPSPSLQPAPELSYPLGIQVGDVQDSTHGTRLMVGMWLSPLTPQLSLGAVDSLLQRGITLANRLQL